MKIRLQLAVVIVFSFFVLPVMAFGSVKITYPFANTVFPPDITAPTILWDDQNGANSYQVTVLLPNGDVLVKERVDEKLWKPKFSTWKLFKEKTVDKWATMKVCRLDKTGKTSPGATIKLSTCRYEVGAPIFYRDVNLPFVEAVKDPTKIKWRFGSISSPSQPPVVLEKLPVCGNCHSFSADGKHVGMDVDYANDKGSYVITNVQKEMTLAKSQVITWADFEREKGERTFGLLSQISPDGRYAVSTVNDKSVFVPAPDLAFSQLFFPVKGILAVYDRQTSRFTALKGADDREYVQSNPCWSPDGKYILFTKSLKYELKNVVIENNTVPLLTKEMCKEFLEDHKTFRFDVYKVPFNNGKGGKAEPLPGASLNGKSNFFPRYSPDGKWIVFCQADSYMLLQKDSELFIMPAQGGKARRMECNTNRMNSWHSWSPNSKWMVFASKLFSAYTQLFLTHIKDDGSSTPPVLLQNFVSKKRAANIPEFVNTNPGSIERINEEFVDDVSFVRASIEYVRVHEFDKAEKLCLKALSINPNNERANASIATILYGRGKYQEANVHYEKVLSLNNHNADVHYLYGQSLMRLGQTKKAKEHLLSAGKGKPYDPILQVSIGNVFAREKDYQLAIERYEAALAYDQACWFARMRLGRLLRNMGRFREAVAEQEKAVLANNRSWEVFDELALAQIELGQYAKAEKALVRARRLAPRNKVKPIVHLAKLALAKRQAKKAEKLLHEALARAPRDGETHATMGDVLSMQGRLRAAKKHYRAALYSPGDKVHVHLALGQLYAKEGKRTLARHHYQSVLKSEPQNVKAKEAIKELMH